MAQLAKIFTKLKSTISSASPAISGAFVKLKHTRVSTLDKQGYKIVRDELSSTSGRKKKHPRHTSAASIEKSTRTEIVMDLRYQQRSQSWVKNGKRLRIRC